jgi:hypothetical protein
MGPFAQNMRLVINGVEILQGLAPQVRHARNVVGTISFL